MLISWRVIIAHYNFSEIVRPPGGPGLCPEPHQSGTLWKPYNPTAMAQTSVHVKAAKSGALEHNERLKKLDHVRDDLTPNNQNWHADGYSGNADLMAEIKADYQEAHGKKLHAKATPVREGVVVIQKDTTMAQLHTAALRCYQEFGIKIVAISMHMDEGHYEDGPTPLQNGPWVGNYHAHLTWCWYDWHTHTTCKLNRDDMAAMQTIFAQELRMGRGTPGTKKALDAIQFKVQKKQEQLAALEQQGKLDTARAAQLREQIADLEQKAADAEKAASREQLKSNLADVGARVAGWIGRGAVAEANTERDEATQRAEEAERQAAADREAREAAEKAAKLAQDGQRAAEAAARKAKEEKDSYGREMYENGVADGVKQGRKSVQASIAPLQEQLAAKDATIRDIQEKADLAASGYRNEYQKVKNELYELKKNGNKEVENMKFWNPHMENWSTNVQEMQEAGMIDQDIQEVFMYGKKEGVNIPVKYNYKTYKATATVDLAKDTEGKMRVWFNDSPLKTFLNKCIEKLRKFSQGRKV